MAGVQSIERAFAILRGLAAGPAGVSELAASVDLPTSTVSRILSTLEAEGVVERIAISGTYRIGEALADLAGAALPSRTLMSAARPFLVTLTEQVGETSGLAILSRMSPFAPI